MLVTVLTPLRFASFSSRLSARRSSFSRTDPKGGSFH